MDIAQAVSRDDIDLFILAFTEMGVDDDGAVVASMDEIRVVSILFHRVITPSSCQGVVELPGKK